MKTKLKSKILARTEAGFVEAGEFRLGIGTKAKFACVPMYGLTTWHDTKERAVEKLNQLTKQSA